MKGLSWASKQFIHSVIPACNPFKWSCLEWQWPWLLFCYFLWLGQFLLFLIQLLLQLRLSDSVPSSSRMSKGLVAFPFQLPNMSMRDMLHSRVWAKTFADLLFVWWWSKLVFGFFLSKYYLLFLGLRNDFPSPESDAVAGGAVGHGGRVLCHYAGNLSGLLKVCVGASDARQCLVPSLGTQTLGNVWGRGRDPLVRWCSPCILWLSHSEKLRR